MIPIYTFPGTGVFSMVIEAVQIRDVTVVVPPRSLEMHGAVQTRMDVIVSIFGTECHATVVA